MRANSIAIGGLALVAVALLARGPLAGNALLGTDLLARKAPFRAGSELPPAKNPLASDPVLCTFPREAAIGSRIHAGLGAVRWEPALGCGEAVALAGAALPDYPPWWLAHRLLPAWLAHGVLLIGHLALALSGAFLLARARGASPRASLVAALVHGLTGHLSVWLELTAWTVAGSWLPWALLGVHRGVARRRWLGLAGLALGASLLGGHLQVAALGLALAALWPLSVPGRWRDRAIAACVAVSLGLAIGAARLVPAAVELRESARERIPWERWFDETASLSGSRWSLLVAPDRLGDPVAGTRIPAGPDESQANPQELRFAPGVVALALALAAARRRPGLALAAALVLALAARSPLAWPLWAFFPGFGATTPTRVLALFPLLAGLLAAHGFDERRGRLVPLLLAGFALLLALDARTSPFAHGRALVKPLALALAGVCAAALAPRERLARALLVALVAFDGAEAVARWNPVGSPRLLREDPPALALVRAVVRPGERVLVDRDPTALDLLLPHGLASAGSYGSAHPSRYARLVDALGGRASRQWLSATRLPPAWRDALAVRAVLVDPRAGTPTVPAGLRLVAEGGLLVFENPGALPRARLFPASRVHVRPDATAALERARTLDPREELLVELPGRSLDAALDAPGVVAAATIVEDEPERVHVRARAAGESWLLLADAFASGWSAEVDGVASTIVPADVAFRAVRLGPGEHDVVFRFVPPGWPWAFVASCVAAALAAALLAVRS